MCGATLSQLAVWRGGTSLPFFFFFFSSNVGGRAQFVTGRHADHAENIGVQVEFMGLLAMVVDRVECKPGVSLTCGRAGERGRGGGGLSCCVF